MEKLKVVDITLPQQKGCNHLHVEVEYVDSGSREIFTYHMDELIDYKDDDQDEIKKYLSNTVKSEKLSNRDQLKDSIRGKKNK